MISSNRRSQRFLPAVLCLLIGWIARDLGASETGPIDPRRMSETVRTLASDAFQGRAPGTAGEASTLEFLIRQFTAVGAEPGGEKGGWTQSVPLLRTQVGRAQVLTYSVAGRRIPLRQDAQIYLSTQRDTNKIKMENVPLVFVGYGVRAPERQWDDFKSVDLRGKIAVMLVNDPDFEATPDEPVAGKFGGRRMTYYGRWPYKYEEAARQGALGALVIHDTPGAGYGWATVIAPGGESYALADPKARRLLLQGWIEDAAASELFKRAGLDLPTLRIAARRTDFRPIELKDTRFNLDVPVVATHTTSQNFLARLKGRKYPGETVIFAAHWDAFGIGSPDEHGQTIRHGAADDALGVAGVLELARALKASGEHDRTLLFAAWTAEERGLIGSEAYATHPLYPLATTVADFDFDILQTAGPARDVLLVGEGQSTLDEDLSQAARSQGLQVTPETFPERGLFYRADHFPLARRGVPVLLLMDISGVTDLIEGGRNAGTAWLNAYMRCYHQPCDSWSESWDLRGAAAEVNLIYRIGSRLADSHDWPAWHRDSEFLSVRQQSSEERR